MDVRDLERGAIKKAYGVESIYFQMTQDWGVKILRDPIGPFRGHDLKFQTPEELLAHDYWKEAMEIAKIMKFFETKKRGPILYEVFIIWDNDQETYAVALKLEHIKFTMMAYEEPETGWTKAKYRAFCRISGIVQNKYGIWDTHNENLVFCQRTKKFKVLDFGSRSRGSGLADVCEKYTPNFTGTKQRPKRIEPVLRFKKFKKFLASLRKAA